MKIDKYIEHIKSSVDSANADQSQLPAGIYNTDLLRGMSTSKCRHFLNNLNSLPKTNYLEIGSWQGSTLCAALYGNPGKIYAIDHFVKDFNMHEGESVKSLLFKHLDRFSLRNQVNFFDEDCFSLDLNKIPDKIDVYFYDGAHSEAAQSQALSYFKSVLSDVFIYVVDDWRDRGDGVVSGAMEGTFAGIKEGFTQHYYTELPRGDYHMGIGIFVLEKK